MATAEAMEKLEKAARRICAHGTGTSRWMTGAKTWGRYQEDRERDEIVVGNAVIEFRDERILACIEPGGRLTVRQNWSGPSGDSPATIEVGPSDATRGAYSKITAYLEGRRPHPEVVWSTERGPWLTARMDGRKILEAGVPRGPGPYVIIMPGGRTAATLREAERLMDNLYFPQYVPISLEPAEAARR